MRKYSKELEFIASDLLDQNASGAEKPNYSKRDFMNTILIFQTALMDKMYDNQDYDKMDIKNRSQMAIECGNDLRRLIHTYTGLDTHEIEQFL
jgi:hypothetical protein